MNIILKVLSLGSNVVPPITDTQSRYITTKILDHFFRVKHKTFLENLVKKTMVGKDLWI